MNNDDYRGIQASIFWMANVVSIIDLEEFLQAVNEAETIGPFSNPTLYMKKKGSLSGVKRLAESLLKFKQEAKRFWAEMPEPVGILKAAIDD